REQRSAPVRGGKLSEKRDENSRSSRVLVTDDPNDSVGPENPRNARRRLALVNGLHSKITAQLLKPLIDEPIALSPDDCPKRNATSCNGGCCYLPVTIMTRHENHAPPK